MDTTYKYMPILYYSKVTVYELGIIVFIPGCPGRDERKKLWGPAQVSFLTAYQL
jgi:hypothetical protein